MKTNYFLLILLIISIHGSAQVINKNKLKISLSSVPLYHVQNSYYGFVIKPGFEYFISNKVSIQNDFFFHQQTDLIIDRTKSKANTFGLIPSVKFTQAISEKITVIAQIGVGFGSVIYKKTEENEYSYDVTKLNSGIIIYSAGIGISYALYKQFEIDLIIPYIIVDNITNSNNSDILFGGIGPTIGIKYTLNNH